MLSNHSDNSPPDSPKMPNHYLVEVGEPLVGKLDDLKIWCWPPVQISAPSIMHACSV
jgi:hypothetical protein